MSYHPDNIDSSDPLNPEGSFFRFMGVTGIQQPYYAGVPVATIEQFYQAIKLRLVYELIQEGLISPDTLEDFSGDGSSEDAGIDSDSKRRPGRPRLTEEEKRPRPPPLLRTPLLQTSQSGGPISMESLSDVGVDVVRRLGMNVMHGARVE